ncbi:MAG: heme-binding protein, partial [Acidobacteria bacterium]|nr:heme-binding protein [Acidobacteriota bacterium]
MLFRLAAAAAAAILSVPVLTSAQVLMQRDVSLKMALAIATTALEECGGTASVAVVDRAGRIRVLLQGDTASPHNPELARRKAYTARTFRT